MSLRLGALEQLILEKEVVYRKTGGSMWPILALLIALTLTGCNNRILGSGDKKDPAPVSAFYVASCCQDTDGAGNQTWPAFVPAEHRSLCQQIENACHTSDCKIGADVYLAMEVNCELDYKIGSQYYKGHGY